MFGYPPKTKPPVPVPATLDALQEKLDARYPNAASLSATFAQVFKPEKYGAVGNGIADDSAAINAAINAAVGSFGQGGAVVFSSGKTYAIASPIVLHPTVAVTLRMEQNGLIKATTAMPYMLYKATGGPATGIVLDSLKFNGNLLADKGIDLRQAHQVRLYRPHVENFLTVGVDLGFGNTQCYEIEWIGGTIIGREAALGGEVSQLPDYGIRTGGGNITDSRFSGIEIKNCHTGVYENGQANWWDKVHVYSYPVRTISETRDWSDGSVGFHIVGNHNRFIAPYADTQQTGFIMAGTTNTLQNPMLLWAAQHTPTYQPVGVDIVGSANTVNMGHWQVGNPTAVTMTGIRVGAVAYNTTLVGNRFVGGASFGTNPIVDLGTPNGWRYANFWSNGTIDELNSVSRRASTMDINLGNASDIIMRWRGNNPGQILAQGSGATGHIRFVQDTANAGFVFGASNNKVGFFGWGPSAKQDANTDVQTALVNYGLLTDGTERSARTGVKGRNAAATLTTAGAEVQTIDASGGAISITLPATTTPGVRFVIKKTDASANAVTVVGTIDGATNYSLATQYQYVSIISTGTSGVWFIVGKG